MWAVAPGALSVAGSSAMPYVGAAIAPPVVYAAVGAPVLGVTMPRDA